MTLKVDAEGSSRVPAETKPIEESGITLSQLVKYNSSVC
jgi:hypothetical protein